MLKWSWLSQPWLFLMADPWHSSFTLSQHWPIDCCCIAQGLPRATAEHKGVRMLQMQCLPDHRTASETFDTYTFPIRSLSETNNLTSVVSSLNDRRGGGNVGRMWTCLSSSLFSLSAQLLPSLFTKHEIHWGVTGPTCELCASIYDYQIIMFHRSFEH